MTKKGKMGVVVSLDAARDLKREQEIDRQFSREIAECRWIVAQEIALASAKGWCRTEYRKILPVERIGAAFCCVRGGGRHTPGRRSEYVSYVVGGIGGRIVVCDAHWKRDQRKVA